MFSKIVFLALIVNFPFLHSCLMAVFKMDYFDRGNNSDLKTDAKNPSTKVIVLQIHKYIFIKSTDLYKQLPSY